VAHRAVWSLIFCIAALGLTKQLRRTLLMLKNPHTMMRLCLSTVLISVNWLVYIWGVNHGHVVECALGYYINPLIIIAFGVLLLKEKMRKLQWIAVWIAVIGVLILTIGFGRPPWIALALAVSWGSYGLVKKQLRIGALEGLAIETLLSFIPYAGYIIWLGSRGAGQFAVNIKVTILLVLAGVVTAIPLLMFNSATNKLPLTIVGLLQYLTPTAQFLIGVLVRHESMPVARWVGFLVIWIALIALATDLVKSGSTSNNRVAQAD